MKRTLTSIAAAAVVLGTLSPMAFASTNTASGLTKAGQLPIVVNGSTLSNPYEMTGLDSGNTTGFFPVFYFDQALSKLGYTANWNGTTKTWAIIAPGVDASSISIAGGVGTGNTGITVNGTVVKKINTQIAKDPAGGAKAQPTTYLPVFYIDEILNAIGAQGSFNGQTGLSLNSAAPFGVASIAPVDAEHVVVNFTQPVDPTTAGTATNYTIAGATVSSATVSADAKSVTLTLSAPLTNNQAYTVDVNKGVEDAAGNVLSSTMDYVGDFYFSDSSVPTVASVSTASNGDVQIQFSENLDSNVTPTVYIDGTAAPVTSVSGNTATIAKAGLPSVTNGTSHSIIVEGAKNLVDNEMSLYKGNFSYNIPAATAPVVTNVAVTSENTFTVSFNEAVTNASVDSGLAITNAAGQAVTPSVTTTDNKTFTVTLPSSIYANNATSAMLNLTLAGYEDSLNDIGTKYTQAIVLNENTAAPQFTTAAYDTTNHDVQFNFNQALKQANANALNADFTIVNNATGVPVSGFTVGAVANDATDVTLSGLAAGSYTINVAANTVAADTLAATGNSAFSTNVTVPASAATATTVSAASTGAIQPNGTEVFAVTYSAPVTGGTGVGSATYVNNYQLNGTVLPAGTTITLNPATGNTAAQTVATITLPKNSIATTGAQVLSTTNITDLSGNVVATSNNTVSLTDNTAPTLQSATVNANGQLVLTFSENVADYVAGDFIVQVNGTTVEDTVSAGASANQVVITSNNANLATGTVTVTAAANPTTADAAGNTLVGGTTVTATN